MPSSDPRQTPTLEEHVVHIKDAICDHVATDLLNWIFCVGGVGWTPAELDAALAAALPTTLKWRAVTESRSLPEDREAEFLETHVLAYVPSAEGEGDDESESEFETTWLVMYLLRQAQAGRTTLVGRIPASAWDPAQFRLAFARQLGMLQMPPMFTLSCAAAGDLVDVEVGVGC